MQRLRLLYRASPFIAAMKPSQIAFDPGDLRRISRREWASLSCTERNVVGMSSSRSHRDFAIIRPLSRPSHFYSASMWDEGTSAGPDRR